MWGEIYYVYEVERQAGVYTSYIEAKPCTLFSLGYRNLHILSNGCEMMYSCMDILIFDNECY